VAKEHVALLGYRELDPGELQPCGELALASSADEVRRLGAVPAAQAALHAIRNDDGPVLIHLDVDVLDPELMPAKDGHTPGRGLGWDAAQELLSSLVVSARAAALQLCEFNPARDPDGRAALGLVALLARAMGARTAARRGHG
jgi:arginase